MMFGPNELLMILALVALLFGASKVPEIARNLGRASVEYKKAQKEAEIELKKLEDELRTGDISKKEARNKLEEIAKSLNINPAGKSNDELIEEINRVL